MRQSDRVLLIVPMFHVLAWGMPYAAMMCGASLVMPDRFLTPEPLAALIEPTRPTLAGGVPTIWAGLLAHLDEHAARHVVAAGRDRRRLGLPALADRGARSGTACTSPTRGA